MAKSTLALLLLVTLLGCRGKQVFTIPSPDPDNGGLLLPGGFRALVVADSVGPTRHIAVNSNGDIYAKLRISKGEKGNVGLRDTTGDGKADIIQRFGDYPNDGPFATEMRIHDGYLYFSSELVVYRQKLTGDLIPADDHEVLVIDNHPLQWHNAKSLAFDEDGGMYVTFSAPTNACEDWSTVEGTTVGVRGFYPCPQLATQAGIWKFSDDEIGQSQGEGERFATGLRSVVAISWNKSDNKLYALDHGSDYLFHHAPRSYSPWQNAVLPAEKFVRVTEGDNYGWPYCYYDQFKNKNMLMPEYGGDGTIETDDYTTPIMGLPAHWAANDLLFYSGDQFPERYKRGAFIAFHGSINRAPYPQAGFVVAFVPFENGSPIDRWEIFADGFAGVDTVVQTTDAKARPMGLSEGPDGSLYISESVKGKIWRVIFTGDASAFGEAQLAGMEAGKTRTYIKVPDETKDLLRPRDAGTGEEIH